LATWLESQTLYGDVPCAGKRAEEAAMSKTSEDIVFQGV
jgi:hypothetical protein